MLWTLDSSCNHPQRETTALAAELLPTWCVTAWKVHGAGGFEALEGAMPAWG